MQPRSLILIISTVSPGTTENMLVEALQESSGLRAGSEFSLAFSPIRATIGKTLEDIVNYPRILGALDERSLLAAKSLLNTIIKGGIIDVSNIRTAEATKVFENVYRDVNIALANDLARFCEKANIDYKEIQKASNTQPYCHLLLPGMVGGHLPKDSYLMIDEAENYGVDLKIVNIARKINEETPKQSFNLIKEALRSCGRTIKRSRVSVLGVAYRPDVREHKGSHITKLIEIMKSRGIKIRVYDPFFSQRELNNAGYPAEKNLADAVSGSNCVVIAVGHNRFRRLNLKRLFLLLTKPAAIVDLGSVINPVKAEKEGFIYRGLGRGVWTK